MSEYITMRDCLKLDLKDAVSQRDEAREAFAIATSKCVDAQQQLRTARNLADAAMWEADRLRSQLWKARDRAWKLARQRSYWRLDCFEQCKLLAMSADREERLL